jgi:hypothetical protein
MSKIMIPTPINVAEAILEPFWDPQVSGLDNWKIQKGTRHGLSIKQDWCWVTFGWMRRPTNGPALSMSLARRIPCAEYDRLLLVLRVPPEARATLVAETDRGERRITLPADPLDKIEIALPLRGAREIRKIGIEIEAGGDGPAYGSLGWVGFQHTRRLRDHLALWNRELPPSEKHLRPVGAAMKFEPAYGFMRDPASIEAARKNPESVRQCEATRQRARKFRPESLRNECLRIYMDNRYNRVRDHVRPFYLTCGELAFAGLVLRDGGLLRLAARTALTLAMCPQWEENVICEFPGAIFEHRCFTHTQLMADICAAMDLAGEAFSETGRDYLLRRLAEEGLGRTNFIVWKHDYTFHNNQLSAFSHGRFAAYAVLCRHWAHVEPYFELAVRELIENFDSILLPDGGYAEGPSYFAYGVGIGLGSLELYARFRGVPFAEVMPPRVRKTGNFAFCLGSTCEGTDFIPFGDAEPGWAIGTLSYFAGAVPDSGWGVLEARAMAHARGETPPDLTWPALIRLPDMGVLASHRRLNGEWVKIFISGCTRDADHNHEDKGSFVLEYAGNTFACDPGRNRFAGSTAASLVKNCELHNMLVPFGTFPERPHPELPHPTRPFAAGIMAEGEGDEQRFTAQVDATRGYEQYFKSWRRRFDSPTPDCLVIRDDYTLARGDGVDFLWQTTLEVKQSGNRMTLCGRRGQASFEIPEGCTATVETVAEERPTKEGVPIVHRRIRIRKPGRKGSLAITVLFN